ncbi:MAG: hypothetical protein IPI12_12880 [Ignavibacteriales bacterium]|jgi:hypothetical protein|nr:hypothetical protein [Ignavibacteriales bacterium]MBK8663444.1 hypothetical protein [Ignavibacteriales bacterium]
MKKIAAGVLILLLFSGCEKEFSSVVDPVSAKFSVQSVARFDTLRFNPVDSLVRYQIHIASNTTPASVYMNLFSPGDQKVNSTPYYLVDNGSVASGDEVAGDKIYSLKVPMSSGYISGEYRSEYYASDNSGESYRLAVSKFVYDNGAANQEPVISDLVAPDTLVVLDTTVFRITMKAIDPNGKQDLSRVYFVVTRPDGTSNNAALLMYDDGNFNDHGDEVSGDDIYSIIVSVFSTNQKGEYTFTFTAEDRGKKKSTQLIKKIVLK